MGTSPPPYLHLPLLANHFLLWRTLPLQLFYSSQFAADPPFVSSWSVLFLLRPSASLPSFSVSQRGSGTQGHQGGVKILMEEQQRQIPGENFSRVSRFLSVN